MNRRLDRPRLEPCYFQNLRRTKSFFMDNPSAEKVGFVLCDILGRLHHAVLAKRNVVSRQLSGVYLRAASTGKLPTDDIALGQNSVVQSATSPCLPPADKHRPFPPGNRWAPLSRHL